LNECEQIHPLLRGFLAETLTARDRRLVARHLNLCASARKEMDRLRSGPLRSPQNPVEPPSEPWDLKVLRWLFKSPGHRTPATPRPNKKVRPVLDEVIPVERPSVWKPILGVLAIFVALAFATHLIQNAERNEALAAAKRWLTKKGFPGMKPTLEMVQDLAMLPSWNGPLTRATGPYLGLIQDEREFVLYWRVLNPSIGVPSVDFKENSLALVLTETTLDGGKQLRFLRAENYSDRTVIWFDETPGKIVRGVSVYRSWALQVVPKPAPGPVLIQKVP